MAVCIRERMPVEKRPLENASAVIETARLMTDVAFVGIVARKRMSRGTQPA